MVTKPPPWLHIETINIYFGMQVPPPLVEVILDHLSAIQERLSIMSKTLDDLTAKVEAIETVGASVIALLAGLKAQLDAAGTDPVALAALSERLDVEAQALSEAVVANTPAETDPAA
jgi:hypothetical protein